MITDRRVEGFAARLRAERVRLGSTQAELASKAGIAKPTQVAYELGSRTPNVDYLVGLADFGIDVWYVLFSVRASRNAAQVFNWELLAEVHSAVSSWCRSRDVELTAIEEIQIGRLLYDQFLGEARVEQDAVDRLMSITASRRVA